MAGKPRPIIIEKSEFRIFLMARMATLGGVAGLAEFLGLSGARIYTLLQGIETPTDGIVEKLGLRSVYILDVESETPAKPTRKK